MIAQTSGERKSPAPEAVPSPAPSDNSNRNEPAIQSTPEPPLSNRIPNETTAAPARKRPIERVSAAQPCEVCGKPDWCSRAGDLLLCARNLHDGIEDFTYVGLTKDGASGMYRLEKTQGSIAGNGSPVGMASDLSPSDTPCGTPDGGLEEIDDGLDLEDLHARCTEALTSERKQALADLLKLPPVVIGSLDIGWWAERDAWLRDEEPPRWANQPGCWSFPERDASGKLVGLNLRFPFHDQSGHAVRSHVGRRGLTLPAGWREQSDPLVCVEGPSDVLAGRLIGLNCIGRPSNTGGGDLIAEACKGRKLILLGENDRKNDGCWPGKDGVQVLRRKLNKAWGRPPHSAFPPGEAKDLRAWVLSQLNDYSINTEELEQDE